MTLILGCLTHDVVYQVSDRRVTSFDPPHAPQDDDSNKAVIVGGSAILGYSGMAKVCGQRSDIWLANAAASARSNDLAVVARTIRQEATNSFARMNFEARIKRHAIQGVGWFADPNARSDLLPGIFLIHNALDPVTGNWELAARPEFLLQAKLWPRGPREFALESVGIRPTAYERASVYRLVRKCVHRREGRERAILIALLNSFHWLTERYEPNSPIGRGLLATVIPKACAKRTEETGEVIAVAGLPSPGALTFLDLPIIARGPIHGPHLVSGSLIATDFRAGALPR